MIEWSYPAHAIQLWIIPSGDQTVSPPEHVWCVELRRHADERTGEDVVYFAICDDYARSRTTTTLVVLGHTAFIDHTDALRRWRANIERDRAACDIVLDRIAKNHPDL